MSEKPSDTGPTWEPISVSIYRVEVPGGWIYEIQSAGDATSTIFVPRPNAFLEHIANSLDDIANGLEAVCKRLGELASR